MAFLFYFGPSNAPKNRFEVLVSDIALQAAARSDLEILGDPASLPALALSALAWPATHLPGLLEFLDLTWWQDIRGYQKPKLLMNV